MKNAKLLGNSGNF